MFSLISSIKNEKIINYLTISLENMLDAKSEDSDEYGIPNDEERDRAFGDYIERRPIFRKFVITFSSLIILYAILSVISQILIYFNMSNF